MMWNCYTALPCVNFCLECCTHAFINKPGFESHIKNTNLFNMIVLPPNFCWLLSQEDPWVCKAWYWLMLWIIMIWGSAWTRCHLIILILTRFSFSSLSRALSFMHLLFHFKNLSLIVSLFDPRPVIDKAMQWLVHHFFAPWMSVLFLSFGWTTNKFQVRVQHSVMAWLQPFAYDWPRNSTAAVTLTVIHRTRLEVLFVHLLQK